MRFSGIKMSDFKYGLLGRKLSHSMSPELHKIYANYEYMLFEKEPNEVRDFIKYGDYRGINVTVPYKKIAYELADNLSMEAKETESVNTLIRERDGTLSGYNTDCFGFEYLIDKNGFEFRGKNVLVLGNGGASSAVKAVLKKKNANFRTLSHSEINGDLREFYGCDYIVNATPVGMYPNCPESPVSLEKFYNLQGIIDLIYNPLKTEFLLSGENIKWANGIDMLTAQGKKSAELFLNKSIDDGLIEVASKKIVRKMQNIVLIGMPGCGKTSVGRALAGKLNMDFEDTDESIFLKKGKNAEEIISFCGEKVFREAESEVVLNVGKKHGTVISTGGGVVKSEKNFYPLKQNGVIIWLKKNIGELETAGRPLSKDVETLNKMYEERKTKYGFFADFSVEVKEDTESTVRFLTEKLKEANVL